MSQDMKPKETLPVFGNLLLIAAVLFILASLFSGCASTGRDQARAVHRVLNTLTDVVDPAYAGTVAACDAAEAYVNARHDTRVQEEADVAAIHADCDRIFAAFEAVRQAQLAARTAVQAAEEGRIEVEEAFLAMQRLQEAWQNVRLAVEGGWQPVRTSGDER